MEDNHCNAHALVKNVRKGLLTTKTQYKERPAQANQKNVSRAQKQVDEAYANAEAEYIQAKIDSISK